MSKRSVITLIFVAAAASFLLLYAKARRSRVPVHTALVSHSVGNPGGEEKAANLTVATDAGPAVQKGFSQQRYDLLWQRYKPNTGVEAGPLSGALLDNLAAIAKNNTRDKKLVPAFEDAVYGKSAALENRLDTGLSADATIYLDYPYNAPVSLLDTAIKAGQRDIIGILLRHSASVGTITEVAPDGKPLKVEAPLPLAAAEGEDDVVRLLLQSGANIEEGRALKTDNETALAAAVTMLNVSTVYLLLSSGADISSALNPDDTVPARLTPPRDAPPRMIALRDLLIEYGAKMPAGQ